jgi:phage N-6-adenine-methyltransferase
VQDETSNATDDCFATPTWLVKALRHQYGDFGLDAAASDDCHVADEYYTATDDALQRDWVADCGGRPIFMNPPYKFGTLEQFVAKAHSESQRGAIVVCVLPFYKSYPWFRQIVWEHAEIRMIQGQVIFSGYGPQAGKCAGNRGRIQFDSVVAIFRPGQLGALGPYIDRPANGQKDGAGPSDSRHENDDHEADLRTYEAEATGTRTVGVMVGSADVGVRGRRTLHEDLDGTTFDEAALNTDECYSPAWLVDAVREVMGMIDLDPASSAEANTTVRAAKIYTRETDGLKNLWQGRVFLNPPFSTGLRPWVEKLTGEIQARRVEQAFVIGPADMLTRLGHQWFRVLISGSLLLPHKRIEFLDPATGRWTVPRFGTFASYWGADQRRFVRVFREKGVILQPADIREAAGPPPHG